MEEIPVPTNFHSIIQDFTNDLSITFAEYSHLWEKWKDPDLSPSELDVLFKHCMKVYPKHFFDILYQKEEIFTENESVEFLPNVNFKVFFSCSDVTEKTKKIIWKYLQLILFTIIGGVKDKTTFGDAANMFEDIAESELNEKISETMNSITDFFQNMETMFEGFQSSQEENDRTTSSTAKNEGVEDDQNNGGIGDTSDGSAGFKSMFDKMGGVPNIEKIQDHLKTLFEGKIGKLAKEMAEEISGDFKDILGNDADNMKDPQDVIKKLMKDPKKMVNLMKTVGGKLDSKMKSGEISRDELMKEASEMLEKMKDIGGQGQFNEMFKNIAKSMGGMGKNMRVDTNALERMTKMSSTRDRMKMKLEQKKRQKEEALEKQKEEIRKRVEMQQQMASKYTLETKPNDTNNLVFKLQGEEIQEKSFIHPDILKEIENTDNNGKNKKKKSKK